jgi:hypothetical protein
MDEALRSLSAGWPSRLAMHYVHERHHRGAHERELVFAHYPDLLPVLGFPLQSILSHPDSVIVQLLINFHDLYTLHDLQVYASPLWVRVFSHARPTDGFKGWLKVIYHDGWKCMLL